MSGFFEIKTSKDDQTYFVLKAGNGQAIIKSLVLANCTMQNRVVITESNLLKPMVLRPIFAILLNNLLTRFRVKAMRQHPVNHG